MLDIEIQQTPNKSNKYAINKNGNDSDNNIEKTKRLKISNSKKAEAGKKENGNSSSKTEQLLVYVSAVCSNYMSLGDLVPMQTS